MTKENNSDNTIKKDAYGREILEPDFENTLAMSKNAVKLNYSRLKNAALSYKFIKSAFEGKYEVFYKGKDALVKMEIEGERVLLYLALKSADLDKKVYSHRTVKEGKLEVLYTVSLARTALVRKGAELIGLTMDLYKAEKVKSPVTVAYAERYPYKKDAVIMGSEHIPPAELNKKDYGDIYGELTAVFTAPPINKGGRPKTKWTGEERLKKIRQTSTTVKGALAISEPIVYYYNAALDRDSAIAYINIQQTLNDRFLGKIIPPQFFAVAEGSERIEKLNFLALQNARTDCELRKDIKFALQVSPRLLIKKEPFNRLLKNSAVSEKNLILSFDCELLDALGDTGLERIKELSSAGVLIMLDNTERASMRVLTEYPIDFIRLDSRYYAAGGARALNHLKMLAGYAKAEKILCAVTGVNTLKQAIMFLANGAEIIEGAAVSVPRRLIHIAEKEKKNLPLSGG